MERIVMNSPGCIGNAFCSNVPTSPTTASTSTWAPPSLYLRSLKCTTRLDVLAGIAATAWRLASKNNALGRGGDPAEPRAAISDSRGNLAPLAFASNPTPTPTRPGGENGELLLFALANPTRALHPSGLSTGVTGAFEGGLASRAPSPSWPPLQVALAPPIRSGEWSVETSGCCCGNGVHTRGAFVSSRLRSSSSSKSFHCSSCSSDTCLRGTSCNENGCGSGCCC
mmetsp:Transcript_79092/g.219783  ORF Transcript_79092/g.219783 Transcript_79092/m.219783 type:complete len:226 (-) Transcript_79092:650-1327(-)